ncbi:MAG: GntP family permease, partial [Janthinobacterium lividum]
AYLESQRRRALRAGEGYGTLLRNEPETPPHIAMPHPLLALSPLLLVGIVNLLFTYWIPRWYPGVYALQLPGMAAPIAVDPAKILGVWAVLAALASGILLILATAFPRIRGRLADGSKTAVGGAMLATLNTASEYGFGAIIAALPGFLVIANALKSVRNPLINEAVTINLLSGITGSSSGGMSIALAAMADKFIAAAHMAHIPLEVLHRVASMSAGGMDTLPHNGAVITLLAVTGLTHREAYRNIFVMTLIKVAASFFVIGVFYATGIV